MKFEHIVLDNFRQYKDRQRVLFSKDPEKNVTVIHGVNGAGKTSFFSAMNWCLYGNESVEGIGSLVNKKYFQDLSTSDSFTTEVELAFQHDGRNYVLKRSIEAIKSSENIEEQNLGESFSMIKIGYDGQATKVPNPLGTINSILPENVRTYFLFNGEKIDKFARPESKEDVRNAIYNVLKLEILERGKKHLSDVATEFRRELRGLADDELKELLDHVQVKRNQKEDKKKRLNELKREIESAEKKISDIDKKLEESKDVRDLQKERARLGKELSEVEEDIRAFTEKIRLTTTQAFELISVDMLEKAISILDEKRIKGEIPSNIREQFLHDLIKQHLCICGRGFEHGSEEHQRLENLLTSSVSSKIEEEVIRLTSNLKAIRNFTDSRKETIVTNMRERASKKKIRDDLSGRMDDISRQLKNSPIEDISALEKKRENFKADIKSSLMERGRVEKQIEDLEKEIKDLDEKIGRVRKEQQEARTLSEKVTLAQNASDAIDSIYQSFADEMRQQIQTETKRIFRLLVWKESQFEDVRLGTDYKLEVIDRWGSSAELELSAGERQVLSLSFIAAMAKVSGEEAPIVMDTPFGRLSSNHREKITSHIPELADQMIMFVTDEELRGQTEKNLEPKIGKRYHLNFEEETGCTHIDEMP